MSFWIRLDAGGDIRTGDGGAAALVDEDQDMHGDAQTCGIFHFCLPEYVKNYVGSL